MSYVWTMVQNIPHIPDRATISRADQSLNELDRARLVKKLQAHIRDVGSDGKMGQFALTRDLQVILKTKKSRKYF